MTLPIIEDPSFVAHYDLTHQLEDGCIPVFCPDMDDLLYWDGGIHNPKSIMGQIQGRVTGFFKKYGDMEQKEADDLANYLYRHPLYGNSPFGLYVDKSGPVQKFISTYLGYRLKELGNDKFAAFMQGFPTGLVKHFVDYMHEDLNYDHLSPNQEMLSRLERVRARGVFVYTFTNAPASHQQKVLKVLGLDNGILDGTNCINDRHFMPKPKPDAFYSFKEAVAADISRRYMSGESDQRRLGSRLVKPFFGDNGHGPHMIVHEMTQVGQSTRMGWKTDSSHIFLHDKNKLVFPDGVTARIRFIFADDSAKNAVAGADHGMATFWAPGPELEIPRGCHLVLQSRHNKDGYVRVAPNAEKILGILHKARPLEPTEGRHIVADLTDEPLQDQVNAVFAWYRKNCRAA